MTAANKVTLGDKPAGIEFAIAGLAGMGTGFLTNPADVLKIRLQLQGELTAPGTYRKTYNGTFHAIRRIVQREGVLGLQAGLLPVFGLQIIVNGLRLGSYHFAKRHGLTVNENGGTNVPRTAAVTGFAGAVAFVIGSPLYLAKIRLQTQAAQRNSLGNNTLNTWIIMKSLWREGGFKSLYRGWYANIPRMFVGSAVQMSLFGMITDHLRPLDTFSDRPILVTFLSSLVSGTVMLFFIHPLDIMSVRFYNQGVNSQGKGVLYTGMLDTLVKIARTEGFAGLYKGAFPNWLRLAPYTILCQVLYEKIALVYVNFNK